MVQFFVYAAAVRVSVFLLKEMKYVKPNVKMQFSKFSFDDFFSSERRDQ